MPDSRMTLDPQLSVVVPLLNEAEGIEPLLRMLARQEGIAFEVILSDGGSTDGTLFRATALRESLHYELRLVTGEQGRGRQLNRGAAAAKGEWLLFLHADSQFSDPRALRKGLSFISQAMKNNSHEWLAGRFALRFDTTGTTSRFGYSFCEGKARLDRSGCILGDQGFLLTRHLFQSIPPFDETLPVAEDLEFAERIRSCGEFLLLPAEIRTSSRRFRVEGYRARQTLNALLMGLLHSTQRSFLTTLPEIYQSHDKSRPLDLEPFFREIAALIATLPLRERLLFWYQIGAYVRANVWQLPFALDVRRTLRQGMGAGETESRWLGRYDRYLNRLTDHPPGKLLFAGVVHIWFFLARQWGWLRGGTGKNEKRAGA